MRLPIGPRTIAVVAIACASASQHSCSADGSRASSSSASRAASAPSARAEPRTEASARYVLRFAGVAVGTTDLSLRRVAGGYRLRRDDQIAVRRDGLRVTSKNSLIVETDASLVAREVIVRAQIGSLIRESTATRDDGGWSIRDRSGQIARRSGLEIAEISMLLATSERAPEPMLLAGASFAVLDVGVARGAGSDVHITVESELGKLALEVAFAADGLPSRWGSDSGESAIRIEGLAPPLEVAELLALAAMPSEGRRSRALEVIGTDRPPPPSVAGQQSTAIAGGWLVTFQKRSQVVPADLAALVASVDQWIEDDLGLPGLSAAEALRMGRGDCSGHASALAMLARARGYRAKLATGYRRRGSSWLRHRWTLVELKGGWVSLDPSFGEVAPGPARLLILATHEPSAESMALADLVAFTQMTAAHARFR